MQRAEGPLAFELGYQEMLDKYVDDPARTEYINELYEDDKKAHFKWRMQFSNAVLVDICETLFSAVKRWIGEVSSSLLMAVVRITEGCRNMILKPFLINLKTTVKKILSGQESAALTRLMKHCLPKLTSWAVIHMQVIVKKAWLRYNINPTDDGNVLIVSRYSADEFLVNEGFQCWCKGSSRPCWQQSYTGLPCNHALLAVLERLTMCRDKDERESMCATVVDSCNKNWHRSTYFNASQPVNIPVPPKIRVHDQLGKQGSSAFLLRFKEVLQYLPADIINDMLRRLETLALEPQTPSAVLDLRENKCHVDKDNTPARRQLFTNPPRRPNNAQQTACRGGKSVKSVRRRRLGKRKDNVGSSSLNQDFTRPRLTQSIL